MSEDLDALIKAALEGPNETTKLSSYQREIKAYIDSCGIVAGDNPIPSVLVFNHFKKTNPKSHLGSINFRRFFKEHFPSYRNSCGYYFKLDPAAFGLPLSYSCYTDKRYYPKSKQKSRKHGKKDKEATPEEIQEQKYYQEFLEAASRKPKDSKT